nr:hypothetical protein HUO10_000044 [Paraburkholderia busanensis]
MNKPSERIVVFVTPAQKRAIAATAENLGISVSELMRRAVLSFGATSEQVKAASIVDRLRAPRAPDALDAALQRVARGTRHARAALPAALQTRADSESGAAAEDAPGETGDAASGVSGDRPGTPGTVQGASSDATKVSKPASASSATSTQRKEPAPLLPAGIAAALAAGVDEDAAATEQAVARMTAAEAAAIDDATAPPREPNEAARAGRDEPLQEAQLRRVLKRPRVDASRDDDDPRTDPSTEGGRFA